MRSASNANISAALADAVNDESSLAAEVEINQRSEKKSFLNSLALWAN